MPRNISPEPDKYFINNVNIMDENNFPFFFHKIKFEKFRHIEDLSVEFTNPITVISGSNKSGKTTVLLSIACSHYNFKRRNVSNGNLERNRWGDIMRFTRFDGQAEDWTYYVDYREGNRLINDKRGQRKHQTNKWNGVAKKESQIGTPSRSRPNGGRSVILIDLDRILPGRGLSSYFLNKARAARNSLPLSQIKKDYMSYIFETNYDIGTISKSADREIFSFKSDNHNYSGLNSASGEDVLSRIISDVVDAENNSLILIEEIEIGLHPKIQRRVMDVFYHEAKINKKQFILTTHSPTILSSVDSSSRIFIENSNASFKSINNISVNAALSKMDSIAYPLIHLFIEDDISEKIIKKGISEIMNNHNSVRFSELINIIISGSADKTYSNFKVHQNTRKNKKIKIGCACILDGDMRNKTTGNNLKYPLEDELFFLYSNDSPELFLVKEYLIDNPNANLQYHLDSNPHCLFGKMIEYSIAIDENDAFEKCWNTFINHQSGKDFLTELTGFLIKVCKKFSPEL